jgi:hypothetical protein
MTEQQFAVPWTQDLDVILYYIIMQSGISVVATTLYVKQKTFYLNESLRIEAIVIPTILVAINYVSNVLFCLIDGMPSDNGSNRILLLIYTVIISVFACPVSSIGLLYVLIKNFASHFLMFGDRVGTKTFIFVNAFNVFCVFFFIYAMGQYYYIH